MPEIAPLNKKQPMLTRVKRANGVCHETRVDQQPSFVLHATPWRETSLIVEIFSHDFGRMGLVAKGAKRPTSQFRGVLVPFAPLSLAWSGRGEVKTLVRAEWHGGFAPLRGDALLVGFYMNELLVRLMARGDPHEALFNTYQHSLAALSVGAQENFESILRSFELDLLRETGWLPILNKTECGAAIKHDVHYRVHPEWGVAILDVPVTHPEALVVRGATLQALNERCWAQVYSDQDNTVAGECRRLLRALLAYRLNGRPLNTRRILKDLRTF